MTVSLASPRMIVFCSVNSSGARSPPSRSTRHSLGSTSSFSMERLSARRIAYCIPFASITFALTNDTAKRNSCPDAFTMCPYHSSRCAEESCFDSLIFRNRVRRREVTSIAPTATGPASGPRPTSSIPMMYLYVPTFFMLI